MKLWHLTVLLVCVACMSALAVWVTVSSSAPAASVAYVFDVDESVGLDMDVDVLRLGSIPPGASARRNITIDASAHVLRANPVGDGAQYIYISPNPVVVTQGLAQVQVIVSVPEGARHGRYEGVIEFMAVNS